MKTMRQFFVLMLCLMLLCVSVMPATAAQTEETTIPVVEINGCETTEGWTADGEITLDTEDMTQGDGCISVTLDAPKDGNSILSVQATFDDVDITDFAMITFDFYISDPSLVFYSSMVALDFGSAKGPDNELISWYEMAFNGVEKGGWYRICLPVQDASNREFNPTSLNYFRLQFFRVNPSENLENVEIKIDNITATIPEYQKLCVADTCDTAEGWSDWTATPQRDVVNKKEGTSSVSFQLQIPEQPNWVSEKRYEPINATGASCVEMDIYISDLEVFKNANYPIEFEITSSGRCDHQEYSWRLNKYVLTEGWNHIRLPISTANICEVAEVPELGGQPDLSRINYFRFHTLGIKKAKDNQLIIRVDNIYFSAQKTEGNVTLGATPIIREPDVEDPPVEDPGADIPGTDIPGTDVPGTDVPGTDTPGTNQPTVEQPEKNENDLRARTTAQRAKILLLVMAFFVIGIDVIAVALRRRKVSQPAAQEVAVVADAPSTQAPSQPAEQESAQTLPEQPKGEE